MKETMDHRYLNYTHMDSLLSEQLQPYDGHVNNNNKKMVDSDWRYKNIEMELKLCNWTELYN